MMNLPTQICLWEMSLKTVHFAIISFSNVEVLIVSSIQLKLSCYVCISIRSVVVFPSRAGTQRENMSLTSYPSGTLHSLQSLPPLSTCSLSNGNMIAYTLHRQYRNIDTQKSYYYYCDITIIVYTK